MYQNKLLRLVGEQFLLAGFATPAMAISGFLIRKKIPVKYVSCRCFRKALSGLRIRKSAPRLRRISNPSQRNVSKLKCRLLKVTESFKHLKLGVPGSGTGVPGSGTGVPGSGTSVPGFGTGVPGSGTSVPGFGIRCFRP